MKIFVMVYEIKNRRDSAYGSHGSFGDESGGGGSVGRGSNGGGSVGDHGFSLGDINEDDYDGI
ncbi:hypothetical protein YC2023_084517 [Brassica napus]